MGEGKIEGEREREEDLLGRQQPHELCKVASCMTAPYCFSTFPTYTHTHAFHLSLSLSLSCEKGNQHTKPKEANIRVDVTTNPRF